MPKEYIVTRSTRRRTDQHGGLTEAVRIGWSPDCNVQIATVLMAPTDGALAVQITNPCDQGQFVDLDRESINRLIRTLRTARDKAFGADA